MPTYGEKWRANSSVCDKGHVPRSHPTPLLRLDSTGEISSVDSSQGERTQFGNTAAAEMNGNISNMKNWVTNRVMGCNGFTGASNLTGSNLKTTDLNANLLNSIANTVQGSVTNTMNTRYPKGKFIRPELGLSGWNYSGHGLGGVNARAFPVFPCHQFSNSFNIAPSAYGHQGKMDMFYTPPFTSARCWMEDHQWHQRHRKYDRSYRGHSPKHHKHEHAKHEKKSLFSEDVPSKPSVFTDKKSPPEKRVPSVSEVTNSNCSKAPVSKSKDGKLTLETDTSVKCSSQSSIDMVDSSTLASHAVPGNNNSSENSGAHELTALKENCHSVKVGCKKNGKKNGVCGITEDLNQMLRLNITNSSNCQANNLKDSRSEKSSTVDNELSKHDSNFQVLFIRKNWKKGRPSASKQRRRKLQKAKSANSCGGVDSVSDSKTAEVLDNMNGIDQKTESSIEDKKMHCSATVSFILGLSQSPTSPNMPKDSSASSSFVFSFSDEDSDRENEDSDGENDDWDTDYGHVNIEADFAQCDLFNFLPRNNGVASSPLNFKLHISPVQNGQNSQSKTIDDINSSWDIQISLKEDNCAKKKRTTKKVHFPEDKKLSVVHPMVVWSYAYQAARKGHWENFVRDRDRFKRRIQEVERVLVLVLDSSHRDTVYVDRFAGTEN